jgi:cobaltochelatase CobN
MKLVSITWSSELPHLMQGARELSFNLEAWSYTQLDDPVQLEKCLKSLKSAQMVLIHPSNDPCWDEIIPSLSPSTPVISFGRDPSLWTVANVPMDTTLTVNRYALFGGRKNFKNLLKYACNQALKTSFQLEPPEEILWQGLYHPRAETAFATVDEYLEWYPGKERSWVGLIFSRTSWANEDLKVVDAAILELEKEFDVLPAFCFGMGDSDLGAWSSVEVAKRFFSGRVEAIVNLQPIFRSRNSDEALQTMKALNVPIFHPAVVYHKTEEEWKDDVHGLSSSEVGWSVAMPEFEGVIEPLMIGATSRSEMDGAQIEKHVPIPERVSKLARRVKKWVALKNKPVSERRVAFILHNNPCASVEASVGGGAHIDTLESVARIMDRMVQAGYSLQSPPKTGKELIETIMARKSIS